MAPRARLALLPPLAAVLASTALGQAVPDVKPHVRFEADAYSKQVRWRTPAGGHAVAAHGTLMPDGRILFIGYERDNEVQGPKDEARRFVFAMTPTPLGQPIPGDVVVFPENVPLDYQDAFVFPEFISDDIFCSANMLTADGYFLSVGGTRVRVNLLSQDVVSTGIEYATLWDGANWARVPQDMQVLGPKGVPGRWYPTVTKLPDGRMLVMSGLYDVYPTQTQNLSAEIFHPPTGTWTILSPHPQAPQQIYNPDYTHTFLLPSPLAAYDLVAFGAEGQPVGVSINGPSTWLTVPSQRPGTSPFVPPSYGASSALLPIRLEDGEWGYSNGSILIAGGTPGTQHMHKVDVFDPVASQWRPPLDLQIKRTHPSTVLLPDGTVLVIAGHDEVTMDPGVTRAQIVDPARGFAVRWGREQETVVRGYHTVSLLLPDGRVLHGGGRDHVTDESFEKSSFRYYYPAYMKKARPAIVSAPSVLGYGAALQVTTSGKAPAEFVLMALGSMTHSVDMNQRYVQLERTGTTSSGGLHISGVVAPPDPVVAPPGFYMLFALDDARVPSVAEIVQVQ